MLLVSLKKTDFNAKVTEIEGKIPSIGGLAISSALTVVENKIPDVSSLVKNRLAAQTVLIRKADFDFRLKEISDRVTKNKTKHLLVENELKKTTKI